MWKLSRFNIISKAEGGNLILCNTLTGAVCSIPHEQFKAVKTNLREKLVNGEEVNSWINSLRRGGFIVKQDVDEISTVKYLANYAAYTGDNLDLRILPTEQCNFRCVYCYEDFVKSEMTAEIRSGLKSLIEKKKYLKRLDVGWFGGEPLIAIDTIEDLSNTFIECSKKFGFRYSAHITTNGFLLDKEMITKIISLGVRRIQITIDGYALEHDKRRKLIDGSGSFEIILQNLKTAAALDENFQLQVRINFDKGNLKSILDLLDALKDIFKGDKRFDVFFRQINNWGSAAGDLNELNLIPFDEAISLQLRFEEEAIKRGLIVRSGFTIPQISNYLCYAVLPYSFVIGSDGTVYKCTVYFDEEINKIGYVDEKGDLKIDINKVAQWVGYHADDDPRCQKCPLLPSCQGTACPAARLMSGHRVCPINLAQLKDGLRIYNKTYIKNPNN